MPKQLIKQWSGNLQENNGHPIPLVWKYQGRTLIFHRLQFLENIAGQPLRYDYICHEDRVWMFYDWCKEPIDWQAEAEANEYETPMRLESYRKVRIKESKQ